MIERIRKLLESDPRISYALLFGSRARGSAHAGSDVDIALGLAPEVRLGALELGELTSRAEAAVGRPVDVVLLDEAPPALAYRIFRDGQLLVAHDRAVLVRRKARAVLEYLDFKPAEELFTRGVLAAATRGR